MNPFYESLFTELESLLVGGKLDAVRNMVLEELSMPYIPEDVEAKLHVYLEQCTDTETQSVQFFTDFASIYQALLKNDELIVKALESMRRLNIRNHMDEVMEALLDSRISDDIKRHILMVLMDQDIKQTVPIVINGSRFEIAIDALQNPFNTPHFQKTLQACQHLFEKNPSMLELAIQELCRLAHLSFPCSMDDYDMAMIESQLNSYMTDLF